MAVIKEKKIKLSSVIENLLETGLADGEPERSEETADGFLKLGDDGVMTISYVRVEDSSRVATDIVITCDTVRVTRGGDLRSDMLFSEGTRYTSLYEVPPYSFDAEIYTRKIRRAMDKDGGRIDIFYTMRIGGADKNVRMRIECV